MSIFRFVKAGRNDRLPLAQKAVQKLRTIRFDDYYLSFALILYYVLRIFMNRRHPNVLTYMDSLDSDEALLLVTEQCTPLQQWLQEVNSNPATSKQNLVYELTWGNMCFLILVSRMLTRFVSIGFKGILKALDFLHSNCSLIHGNVGPHSIFITQNGDWKLGAFELACNVNNTDEVDYFCNNHNILETSLQPPERVGLRPGDSGRIDTALKSKVPPYYLDVFSFGRSVERVFEDTSTDLTGSLSKYVATTVSSDMKKRPQAAKLLQAAVFNSDYIKILENVQEFSIKGQKEILESIKELDPLLPQMTVPICSHKVLPSVCKALQIAVNDFQNRDAREGCRQVSLVFHVDSLVLLFTNSAVCRASLYAWIC